MHPVHLEALDLNQLLVLGTLLETRSVTRAADRLGLSQSATSHALGRLRVVFDDPLLLRGPNEMIPTARAAALAPGLRAALASLRAALAPPVPFEPRTAERHFAFATDDYTEAVLLPALVKSLRQEAPRLTLLVSAPPSDIVESLAEGRIDLATGPSTPSQFSANSAGIRSELLFDERFVCILRRDHPALAEPWTLERFAALDHAVIAPRGRPGGIVDERLDELGLARNVALYVPHFLVAPFVIAESDLVLTLPERVARTFAGQLPLTLIEPPLALPGFSMLLHWHERSERDPAHRFLREMIRSLGGAAAPQSEMPPSITSS